MTKKVRLSATFQTIFQQPDAASVRDQVRDVGEFWEQRFPHLADYLEEPPDQLLAFTHSPKSVGIARCGRTTPPKG